MLAVDDVCVKSVVGALRATARSNLRVGSAHFLIEPRNGSVGNDAVTGHGRGQPVGQMGRHECGGRDTNGGSS